MSESFSSKELDLIRGYLLTTLSGHPDGRVKSEEVYEALSNSVGVHLKKVQFIVALSSAIKEGKIPGVIISPGRYGGIKFAPLKVEEEIVKVAKKKEPEPVVVPPPPEPKEEVKTPPVLSTELPKEIPTSYIRPQGLIEKKILLKIDGTSYQVPLTLDKMETLLQKVVEVVPDNAGSVDFNGQKYRCNDEQKGYLDRFLFYLFGSSIVIEGE